MAIDCDNPEAEVQQIWVSHMAWARSLPFVFYADADGEFLHGTSGGRSVAELLADLERVAGKK